MKLGFQLLAAGAFVVLAAGAGADVPNLLNYQGRLTDPSGAPKNGTFTMQFAVYDAETGGNQLPTGTPWSETQSVTVTNGVFNVLLGSVAPGKRSRRGGALSARHTRSKRRTPAAVRGSTSKPFRCRGLPG